MALYIKESDGFLAADNRDDIQLGAVVTANGTAIGRVVSFEDHVGPRVSSWEGAPFTVVHLQLTSGSGFAVGHTIQANGIVAMTVRIEQPAPKQRRPSRYALALREAA